MKWKLFFQIVLLIILIALIGFVFCYIIKKGDSDVGRYVVKNANLNFSFWSKEKSESGVEKSEELIKIDTVTGTVWRYYQSVSTLDESNPLVIDTWQVLAPDYLQTGYKNKEKTLVNKIINFFKK